MGLDRVLVEDIRRRHDLRTIWPYYSGRQRVISGRYFVDKCPYHEDSHPSMLVYADRAYCMACGEYRDVFALVMEQQGCSFADALRVLQGGALPVLRPSRARAHEIEISMREEPEGGPIDGGALNGSRPVERAYLEEAGLGWLDMEIARRFDLRVDGRGLVVVPVFEDRTLVNVRLYNPGRQVSGYPKWIPFEAGHGSQLYHSDGIVAGERVIVVESEKDVWAGTALYPDGPFRFVATAGASKFTYHQRRRLAYAGEVYVLGDNDSAGQRFNLLVQRRMAMAQPLWWAWLVPGVRLEQGFDVADFVCQRGDASLFDEFMARSCARGLPIGVCEVDAPDDL